MRRSSPSSRGPVRVQGMRRRIAWTEGRRPCTAAAALDASDDDRYEFVSKASRRNIDTNESDPRDSLAACRSRRQTEHRLWRAAEAYGFDNKLLAWEVIPRPRRQFPLRSSNCRSGRTADPVRQRAVHRRAAPQRRRPGRVPAEYVTARATRGHQAAPRRRLAARSAHEPRARVTSCPAGHRLRARNAPSWRWREIEIERKSGRIWGRNSRSPTTAG